ncbi:MAG: amidohydrolase family protein [Oscillospiraceae bacterium]|nr:amidohydrolase family protein [Oscillospiraceae bacterium]
MPDCFALRGNVCFASEKRELMTFPRTYVICEDGLCRGVCPELPREYAGIPIEDYGDCLIIPGMVDLHIHAPQFTYRSMGMDCELMEWLRRYAFPEEARYKDLDYAARAYGLFAGKMSSSATTRAVIFGTVHRDATILLMDLMESTGLISFVGKVNMDRNAPDELREESADASAFDTFGFINEANRRGYLRTKPILTPRFIPSCSDALLNELSEVRRAYDLPVQSHLSENPDEVRMVMRLMPDAAFYGDGYDRFGLFGREARTVMAHCIYSTDAEIERIRQNSVWVAHCPNSNMNLASGIAPVRRYLREGIRVGLGSDVAGGQTESMFRAVTDAIQVSKLYWRYVDEKAKPLTFPESFALATRSGGSFFGRVGSFEDGFEFDAVVLDDSVLPVSRPLTLAERLERAFYLGLDQHGIRAKYVRGLAVDRDFGSHHSSSSL